jgi:hypothetical protein
MLHFILIIGLPLPQVDDDIDHGFFLLLPEKGLKDLFDFLKIQHFRIKHKLGINGMNDFLFSTLQRFFELSQ